MQRSRSRDEIASFAPFRPLDDFATGSARFAMPKSDQKRYLRRVFRNLNYYQTNYIVFAMLLLSLCILLNPFVLMVAAVTAAGWWFVLVKREGRGPLVVGQTALGAREQKAIMGSTTAILWFFSGSFFTLLGMIVFTVASILLHASFRKPNLKNKLANFAETVGPTPRTPFTILLERLGAMLGDINDSAEDESDA